MQAILYVAHGSRVEKSNQQAIELIERVINKVDVPIQEVCFLELREPLIEAGITSCVKRGATKVAVVPLLLLEAAHAKVDIPQAVRLAHQKYPHLTISYGKPIGVHEKMIALIHERIQELIKRKPQDTAVLLIGRGSSDESQTADIKSIGSLLQQRFGYESVDVCFITAARPTVEEGLQQLRARSEAYKVVMPYLLFSGTLIRQLQGTVKEIPLCDTLGGHPFIEDVLIDRIKETIQEGVK
ncbi:sirohydrochlorin chelatase [Bacillus tianshenii]|nr:sirohydrochlorin chelatase [Bacillus tianshenii]